MTENKETSKGNMHIFDELKAALKTNFQRELFDGALMSLRAVGNPLRLNNFSTAIRELVRDLFDHLAPNEQIKQCSWYVPDPTSATGVTRGHRVSYVIHGGISPAFAQDDLQIDVTSERKRLTEVVNTLSKFTHVTINTFNTPSDDVDKYGADACTALLGVLIAADEARQTLVEAIQEQVEEDVVQAVISETVMSVDEIATHHCIDEVELDLIEVVSIDAKEIQFIAHGSICVELQWGSNSDVRNDMGAIMNENFPLSMKFSSSVASPSEVTAVENSLSVDTSDWYDDYYDEE
ncbi:hypothetical protein [Undibacterium baiyunense]|uniref:Uncharacterized protein n=1 Tax=Undibacterium baiyunense TaxID=2828731 RepID=A0A941DDU4_9BURK|nr:hypothetical protein [Undibacterium baiyunense]MBR7745142.1 hypothetical protein [Undibacterium baiyunense]